MVPQVRSEREEGTNEQRSKRLSFLRPKETDIKYVNKQVGIYEYFIKFLTTVYGNKLFIYI